MLELSDCAPMETAQRIGRLRALMSEQGHSSLLVSNASNLRYLTGFTGSSGAVLVSNDEALFVTDGRYTTQSHEQLEAAGVSAEISIITGEPVLAALGIAVERGWGTVALESEAITWAQQLAAAKRFGEAGQSADSLVPTSGLLESLRIVKDQGEVDRIECAAGIADAALGAVLGLLDSRPTEREFAMALDAKIRALGAEGNSFETIVASGPNGALPHARPTSRRISDGDLVVVDFGALVDGYCSDMTRTIRVGSLSADCQAMYDMVIESQQAGVDAVVAGATAAQVDSACRDVLSRHGWAEYFTHGTGHGVGIDIHEAPRIAATSDATLEPGFIVTVEPGVYRLPFGGVRIEDTLVVTSEGSRALTKAPKQLVVA